MVLVLRPHLPQGAACHALSVCLSNGLICPAAARRLPTSWMPAGKRRSPPSAPGWFPQSAVNHRLRHSLACIQKRPGCRCGVAAHWLPVPRPGCVRGTRLAGTAPDSGHRVPRRLSPMQPGRGDLPPGVDSLCWRAVSIHVSGVAPALCR